MNLQTLVTVLINCRNEEKFISRSIKSVLSQTHKNLELLIWDDASDDNTAKVIKSFKDSRVKYFKNKKHKGLGFSRCEAQNQIKGELVAILDADDEMSPNRIEKQVKEFLENKNLSIVGSWVTFKNENGKIIKDNFLKKYYNIYSTSDQIRDQMLWKNIFAHSSIMYKKDNAIKVGWYSKKLEYSQDYDLSIKLIKDYDSKIITEKLTFITIRKSSMSQSKQLQRIRLNEYLSILQKCKSDYKMNKKISFLNSREISLNKLKLILISDKSFITKCIFVLKTLINFPSLFFLRYRIK